MIKVVLFISSYIFIFSMIFIDTSYANENQKTYNVGIFHLPPWGEEDENGQIIGVIYDIFQRLEKESGLKFNYKLIPYSRMIKDLQRGKIDLAIFLERSQEDKGITRIALTHYEEIIVYCNNNYEDTRWEDIDNTLMAVPLGVNFGENFKRNKNIDRHFVKHYRNSIEMYREGRVDSFIGPKSALFHHFDRLNISRRDLPDPITLDFQQAFLHAPSDNLDRLPMELLTRSVRNLRVNGEIHHILMRYYGAQGITYAPLPALLNYSK